MSGSLKGLHKQSSKLGIRKEPFLMLLRWCQRNIQWKGKAAIRLSHIILVERPSNSRTRPEKRFYLRLLIFKIWVPSEKKGVDFPRACFWTQLPPKFLGNRKGAMPKRSKWRRGSCTANPFCLAWASQSNWQLLSKAEVLSESFCRRAAQLKVKNEVYKKCWM